MASGRQAESYAKHIFSPTNTWEASTYYVRDAQGNVMATYLHTTEEGEYDGQPVTLATYTVSERHIYGSSRLGMDTTRIELLAYEPPPADHVYTTNADDRMYELTNHLGNVLATFTARKLPTTDNGEVTGFMAHVTSLSDYYPFGSALAGRMVDDSYRYGFNGMEREGEIHNPGSAYDFGARMYDGRLGRFLSVDPEILSFPSLSSYSISYNNPIFFIDQQGKSGIAYKTGEKNERTGNEVIRVVSKDFIYGPGATPERAEMMASEFESQFNRNGDYFTYEDESGKVFDVIFEHKVEVIGLGDALVGISQANPENNYYLVAEGWNEGESATLKSGEPGVVGGNTGYLAVEQIDKQSGSFAHEKNHGFGGDRFPNYDKNNHPASPQSMGLPPNISWPSNQLYSNGSSINPSERTVNERNIALMLEVVIFNSSGVGIVGHARKQAYNPTKENPDERFDNVAGPNN